MKKLNILSKYGMILASLVVIFFTACSEDYPSNVESPNEVVLKSIKILNAGADGTTVVEGRVDEDTKSVWFPRLDPATDMSAIRFEAVMSDGAKLENDVIAFDFTEGEDSKDMVIKVVNDPRFREYKVTLRLNVPVYGADFGKPQIYDNTGNELGNPLYPTFVSASTRGSGFDGKHVLVVTRAADGSHLLDVNDLKNNEIKPIPLNLTGVSGGTLPVNLGAQINGHTYIANLSGGLVSPLKIYHWTDPAQEPQVIANINKADIPGAGARHGDNLSINLDDNGNGHIFFGDNASSQILRFSVTNYTQVGNPRIIEMQSRLLEPFMNMNRVGTTDNYLLTGHAAPIMVASVDGTIGYRMANSSIPIRSSDPRVVYFNGERYLLVVTAARGAGDSVVLYIYNITRGENISEALELFESGDMTPLYQFPLMGPVNTSPSTQTGWYVTKDAEGNDETLMVYGASTDAGFVIIEFPKKSLDD